MRVLVTGGAGFVGRQLSCHLSDHGHDVIATYHTNPPGITSVLTEQLDVLDETQVRTLLVRLEPDVVVHAAALVDADLCEREPDRAWETNVEGTEAVARSCEAVGAKLILLSSSFVFSGDTDLYVEESTRDPVNVYGETKVAAEDIVREAAVTSIIVRIDQPYGWSTDWQSPTMVEWVLNRLDKEDGPLGVFSDWRNNPVYNTDVAACIQLLLGTTDSEIYHIVGPEHISRYHWARRIATVFGYDVDRIQPELSTEASLEANRPNANLSSTRLIDQTGYIPVGTYDGLNRMIDESSSS